MTDKPAPELPPLPEPAAWNAYWKGDNDSVSWSDWYEASDPLPSSWDSEPPDEVTALYTAEQMHAFRAEGVSAAVDEVHRLRLALLAIATAAQTNPAARRLACDVLAANAIRATLQPPKGTK